MNIGSTLTISENMISMSEDRSITQASPPVLGLALAGQRLLPWRPPFLAIGGHLVSPENYRGIQPRLNNKKETKCRLKGLVVKG